MNESELPACQIVSLFFFPVFQTGFWGIYVLPARFLCLCERTEVLFELGSLVGTGKKAGDGSRAILYY
jgi:hypothetical protein